MPRGDSMWVNDSVTVTLPDPTPTTTSYRYISSVLGGSQPEQPTDPTTEGRRKRMKVFKRGINVRVTKGGVNEESSGRGNRHNYTNGEIYTIFKIERGDPSITSYRLRSLDGQWEGNWISQEDLVIANRKELKKIYSEMLAFSTKEVERLAKKVAVIEKYDSIEEEVAHEIVALGGDVDKVISYLKGNPDIEIVELDR